MPVADYQTYCKMLDRAREKGFAYPAINVTSLVSANAVLQGLAESRSDGIIQVSTGGAAFASGSSVRSMALGAMSIAEHVHLMARRYPVYVALHTDRRDLVFVVWILLLVQRPRRRRRVPAERDVRRVDRRRQLLRRRVRLRCVQLLHRRRTGCLRDFRLDRELRSGDGWDRTAPLRRVRSRRYVPRGRPAPGELRSQLVGRSARRLAPRGAEPPSRVTRIPLGRASGC